jgi:hypothetical protein
MRDLLSLAADVALLECLTLREFIALKCVNRELALIKYIGPSLPLGLCTPAQWHAFHCANNSMPSQSRMYITSKTCQKDIVEWSHLSPNWLVLRSSMECDFCYAENLERFRCIYCVAPNRFNGPKCDFCDDQDVDFFLTPQLDSITFDRIKSLSIARHLCLMMCKKVIFNWCIGESDVQEHSIPLGGEMKVLTIRADAYTFPSVMLHLHRPLILVKLFLDPTPSTDSLDLRFLTFFSDFLADVRCDRCEVSFHNESSSLRWLTERCLDSTQTFRTTSLRLTVYYAVYKQELPSLVKFVEAIEFLTEFHFAFYPRHVNFDSTIASLDDVRHAFMNEHRSLHLNLIDLGLS